MTIVKKPVRGIILLTFLLLFTIIVLDTQFKQLERLQVRVKNREIRLSQAIHREIYSGLFSGAVITYGTSTISHKLFGMIGLSITTTMPVIASTYLKFVEVWRNQRIHVFTTVFPLWYLFGACLGYLLLATEFTIRGVDGVTKRGFY